MLLHLVLINPHHAVACLWHAENTGMWKTYGWEESEMVSDVLVPSWKPTSLTLLLQTRQSFVRARKGDTMSVPGLSHFAGRGSFTLRKSGIFHTFLVAWGNQHRTLFSNYSTTKRVLERRGVSNMVPAHPFTSVSFIPYALREQHTLLCCGIAHNHNPFSFLSQLPKMAHKYYWKLTFPSVLNAINHACNSCSSSSRTEKVKKSTLIINYSEIHYMK